MKQQSRLSPIVSQVLKIHPTVKVAVGLTALYLGLLFVPMMIGNYPPQGLEVGLFYKDTPFSSVLKKGLGENKPCFVKFYAKYCYPCDLLDKEILSDPQLVRKLQKDYALYKIDGLSYATGGLDLAKQYNIQEYPTILITDSEGEEISRISYPVTLKKLKNCIMRSDFEVDFTVSEKDERTQYGLYVKSAKSLGQARYLADQETHLWDYGVWIYPKDVYQYDIVIGAFTNRKDAELSANVVREWEGKEMFVVELNRKPVEYVIPGLKKPEVSKIPSTNLIDSLSVTH